MIKNSNVKYIGTTDDPIDNLEYHIAIAKDENFDCEVRPSFRPDKAVKIHGEGFAEYIVKLGEVENTEIKDYETLLTVLEKRLDFFVENGCNITDHSLERVLLQKYNYRRSRYYIQKCFSWRNFNYRRNRKVLYINNDKLRKNVQQAWNGNAITYRCIKKQQH